MKKIFTIISLALLSAAFFYPHSKYPEENWMARAWIMFIILHNFWCLIEEKK